MFSKTLLVATLMIAALSFASKLHASQLSSDLVYSYSDAIYDELVEIRRDLHKHPEASGKEKRTSAVVVQYLKNLGLEVKTNVGGYGVVGILKGAEKGKHIAWRADMDAAKYIYGQSG